MLAVLAFVAFAITGILKLIGKDPDAQVWLLIIGGLLVAAEVAWGWNRGGRYGRTRTTQ
jgi:hypothetical protein